MTNSKKSKILFLMCVCFIFLLIFCFSFKKDDIKFLNQIYDDNLVLNVLINNELCSYDADKDVYYYYSKNTDFFDWKFRFNSLSHLKYYVADITDDVLFLKVYSDKYYQDIKIVITRLPIIDLHDLNLNKFSRSNDFFEKDMNVDLENSIVNEEKKFFVKISDNYNRSNVHEVGLKVRGTSSTIYPKKSYKLSLDEKISIYNLPKDDKYVLDAAYIDMSRIRNLLSTDVWNLINNNQNIQNDLYGNFIELFIDDDYKGLYILKEKVDKSVTNISDDGILLKAFGHLLDENIISFLDNPYSITDDLIINFEIKKYSDETYYSFVQKMKKIFTLEKNYDLISDTYYIDNYLNYKIFVSLISGDDNLTSNQYYSMIDSSSKILITPWDMDLTWGLYWNYDLPLHSEFSFSKNFNYDWMNSNITNNMDYKTFSMLKQRYWELRKDVITMNTINNYLNSYKKLLVDSGAAKRDSEKWYQYDIEYEIEQIREWACRRIQFLDEYFK